LPAGAWPGGDPILQHWYWRWKTKRLAVRGDGAIPFARLAVPLSGVRVALITTAGVHRKDQPPFDCETGDWSCRPLGADVLPEELTVTHTHYDTADALADPDVVFPLRRLHELAADGIIGSVSPIHFGLMGYIPTWAPLVQRTAPEMARTLRDAGVQAVVASPG